MLETTAMGAAWLAGAKAGVLPGEDEFAAMWSAQKRFQPQPSSALRDEGYARWKQAVAAVIGYAQAHVTSHA